MWLGQSGVTAWREKGGSRRLRRVIQILSLWAALAGLWSTEPIWQQDEGRLADGFWEGSLEKGGPGKGAEGVQQLACLASGCRDK